MVSDGQLMCPQWSITILLDVPGISEALIINYGLMIVCPLRSSTAVFIMSHTQFLWRNTYEYGATKEAHGVKCSVITRDDLM